MNDAELLRRYAEEGSQEAFAELVRLRIGLVYSAALRLTGGDSHSAQEIAQIVFTDLARKADSLCRHRALIGWLYTSTHYAATVIARSERRRRAREQEAYTMHEILASPAPEIPAERFRPLLDDAMRQLSEPDRRALLLRFFGGYSMAELGRSLGLSESTAQKRVERALGRLKALLAKRGLASTAAAVGAALSQEVAAATVPAGLAATVSGSALAAASAVGPGIGLVSLMSTSKATALAISGALIIAAGIATIELRATWAAAGSLAAATRERDDLISEAQALELRSQQALRDRSAAERTVASLRAANGAEHVVDVEAAGAAFVAAHPEVKAALVARSRARTLARYGALFDILGLSSQQIRQFEDVVMQRTRLSTDALRFNVGTTWAQDDQVDNELHELLGDAGFQQYQQYQQMMPAHQLMANLAGAMYFTATPLTASQAAQLSQIVAANTATTAATGSFLFNGLVGGLPWKTLLAKAPDVLSAAQLPVLMDVYQQALFQESAEAATKQGQQ